MGKNSNKTLTVDKSDKFIENKEFNDKNKCFCHEFKGECDLQESDKDINDFKANSYNTELNCRNPNSVAEEVVRGEEGLEEKAFETEAKTKSIDFNDEDCGDPIPMYQYLVLNFTPVKGDDDPVLEEKCLEFWRFVRKTEYFDKFTREKTSQQNAAHSKNISEQDQLPIKEETKASAYNWFMSSNVDKMDLAMEVQDRCHCEPNVPEHWCNENEIKNNLRQDSSERSTISSTTSKSVSTDAYEATEDKLPTISRNITDDMTKKLCELMMDWTHTNPKSMEPPGHIPDRGLHYVK